MGFTIKQNVSLYNPKSIEVDAGEIAYRGDALAHEWVVELQNSTAWLKGKTATVSFLSQNGITNTVNASIDGNIISASVPAAVYGSVGNVSGFMKVSGNGETVTVAVLRFAVIDMSAV